MAKKKQKKRIETSKLLLYILDTMLAIVIAVSIYATFKFECVTILEILIPSLTTIVLPCHGFYYWKAKCENLNKWGQGNKINMEDQSL